MGQWAEGRGLKVEGGGLLSAGLVVAAIDRTLAGIPTDSSP